MLADGTVFEQPAVPAQVIDTLGAGDALIARRHRGAARRRPAAGCARAGSTRGGGGMRAHRCMAAAEYRTDRVPAPPGVS